MKTKRYYFNNRFDDTYKITIHIHANTFTCLFMQSYILKTINIKYSLGHGQMNGQKHVNNNQQYISNSGETSPHISQ